MNLKEEDLKNPKPRLLTTFLVSMVANDFYAQIVRLYVNFFRRLNLHMSITKSQKNMHFNNVCKLPTFVTIVRFRKAKIRHEIREKIKFVRNTESSCTQAGVEDVPNWSKGTATIPRKLFSKEGKNWRVPLKLTDKFIKIWTYVLRATLQSQPFLGYDAGYTKFDYTRI